jgi:hypothetical protein
VLFVSQVEGVRFNGLENCRCNEASGTEQPREPSITISRSYEVALVVLRIAKSMLGVQGMSPTITEVENWCSTTVEFFNAVGTIGTVVEPSESEDVAKLMLKFPPGRAQDQPVCE